MRFVRRTWLLSVLSLSSLAALPVGASASEAQPSPDSYLVVYRPSVTSVDARTAALARAEGFDDDMRFRHAVKGFAAELSPDQVAALDADPSVAYVARDRPLAALGVVWPTGVRRIGAATLTGARWGASNTGVAVVDTGIDLTNPALDAVDAVNCAGTGPAQDENGHGTHVAGTIGASDIGAGVVGVTPGTRLYSVKVLDAAGNGSTSTVVCGIDWVAGNAAARGISVANLSLGGPGTNDGNCGNTDGDPLHQAICRLANAGVTPVVAAGNSGVDLSTETPAAYPEALTVTAESDSDGATGGAGSAPGCDATERDEYPASFSNYATADSDLAHTIAAPGVCITSTYLGGGYATGSGTSMAAPHVAGVVAACLGTGGSPGPCAGLSSAQVIAHVRAAAAQHSTTTDPGFGFCGDPTYGLGAKRYGYLVWGGPTADPAHAGPSCPGSSPYQPPPGPVPALPAAPVPVPAPVPSPAPSVVPLPAPPEPASIPASAPAPLRLTLSASSRPRIGARRAVVIQARCTRSCRIRSLRSSHLPGTRAGFVLIRAVASASDSRHLRIEARTTRRGLAAIRRARAQHRRLVVIVSAIASPAGAGPRARAVLRLRLA